MRKDGKALAAMARANARYWPMVLPRVQRGLRRWEQEAGRIPDGRLRAIALEKLAEERFNTEVAATLATLAPRPQRGRAIEAIVPMQVMYDYLDGVSEEPAEDPLANGRRLFNAFTVSLGGATVDPPRYYAFAAAQDDGGYLEELVAACRQAFAGLPAAAAAGAPARQAALRCGESQTRTHSIPVLGVRQLQEWASPEAAGKGLDWWELAAGATASILCVHALVVAAADPATTRSAAAELDRAYLYIAAISTLLDSLVDRASDMAEERHSFISYYADEAAACEGIGKVIACAAEEARLTRHGAHHQMTAAGVAAYYLSAPSAASPNGAAIRARALQELGAPLRAALGVFGLWRAAKSVERRRGRSASAA